MVILISGDSDYLAPIKSIHSRGKSIRILAFKKSFSWELRTFAIENTNCDYKILEDLRKQIKHLRS